MIDKHDVTPEMVWKRDEVDSPCVQVCVVHPEARICIGCHRSIDEIARWSKMTDTERAEVRAELPGRASRLVKRRGGRGARVNADKIKT